MTIAQKGFLKAVGMRKMVHKKQLRGTGSICRVLMRKQRGTCECRDSAEVRDYMVREKGDRLMDHRAVKKVMEFLAEW